MVWMVWTRVSLRELVRIRILNVARELNLQRGRQWVGRSPWQTQNPSISEMAILRQLSVRPVFEIPSRAGFFSDVLAFENEAGRG